MLRSNAVDPFRSDSPPIISKDEDLIVTDLDIIDPERTSPLSSPSDAARNNTKDSAEDVSSSNSPLDSYGDGDTASHGEEVQHP